MQPLLVAKNKSAMLASLGGGRPFTPGSPHIIDTRGQFDLPFAFRLPDALSYPFVTNGSTAAL